MIKKPQSGNSATHRKWMEGQAQWLSSTSRETDNIKA
jgi:hypothetical protein